MLFSSSGLIGLTCHRDAGTASSAIQFLTLSSGGNLEPWIATHDTIRNVRQLAHNSMPSRTRYIEPEPDYTRDIYLRRRVFTKVLSTHTDFTFL